MTISTILIWFFGIILYIVLFGVIGGKICKKNYGKNYGANGEDIGMLAVAWPFIMLALVARIILHPLCWLVEKIAGRVARRKK